MRHRAHLKLIVSESPPSQCDEAARDRTSMVQPVSTLRLRVHWLKSHASLLALWSASAVLLSLAGLVALGWL
jgi:hypothetical protein